MRSRGYAGLPPFGRGQRIGLFGGSFNPAHDGHRAVSLLALHRLDLDWIWWLVTPGNPLKDTRALPPIAERIETACAIARHPRIVVTGIEAQIGSAYTCDVVAALTQRVSQVHFVWIMGADSFADFHHWKNWRAIAETVPMAIVDRPGFTLNATQARAAASLHVARLDETDAVLLAGAAPPAYVFLHGPRSHLSSTQLRSGRNAEAATTSP